MERRDVPRGALWPRHPARKTAARIQRNRQDKSGFPHLEEAYVIFRVALRDVSFTVSCRRNENLSCSSFFHAEKSGIPRVGIRGGRGNLGAVPLLRHQDPYIRMTRGSEGRSESTSPCHLGKNLKGDSADVPSFHDHNARRRESVSSAPRSIKPSPIPLAERKREVHTRTRDSGGVHYVHCVSHACVLRESPRHEKHASRTTTALPSGKKGEN